MTVDTHAHIHTQTPTEGNINSFANSFWAQLIIAQ